MITVVGSMNQFKLVLALLCCAWCLVFTACRTGRDSPHGILVSEINAARTGSAEERVTRLLTAVSFYVEHEKWFSSSDRKEFISVATGLLNDEQEYAPEDGDVQISVAQMAAILLAFMGDDSHRHVLRTIPDNTAAFPDLSACAMLWLGDTESVHSIHRRMLDTQMWSLDVLSLADAVMTGVRTRLTAIKATTSDMTVSQEAAEILAFWSDKNARSKHSQ